MTPRGAALAAVSVLLLLATVATAAGSDTLAAAYKKEFAFLEGEKKSLTERLAQHDEVAAAKRAAARQDVATLQSRLVALSNEADILEEELLQFDRESEDLRDTIDGFAATVAQAEQSLEGFDATLPELEEPDAAALQQQMGRVLTEAMALLKKSGGLRTESGEFFLADGSKAKGTIAYVGRVAAVGSSDGGGGVLAPAGDGRLKVWPTAQTVEEDRIIAGNPPDTLRLFLFESLDKPVERKEDKTIVEVIQSGGVIGWIIVFLGLGALAMVAARTMFLAKAASRTDELIDQVTPLVEAGQIDDALDLCRSSKGATSRVLQATIRNLDRDTEHLEDIISESILHETPFLDRFGASILVFAAVAPLLGLLGTVTGMISTFDVITEFGTGDPKLLSGGISEALVTTQLGLIVAIPSLLLGNLLSGWAEKIKSGMENAALTVTNRSIKFRGDPQQG